MSLKTNSKRALAAPSGQVSKKTKLETRAVLSAFMSNTNSGRRPSSVLSSTPKVQADIKKDQGIILSLVSYIVSHSFQVDSKTVKAWRTRTWLPTCPL